MVCAIGLGLLLASFGTVVGLLTWIGWLYPVIGPGPRSKRRLRPRRAFRPSLIALGGLVVALFMISFDNCFV